MEYRLRFLVSNENIVFSETKLLKIFEGIVGRHHGPRRVRPLTLPCRVLLSRRDDDDAHQLPPGHGYARKPRIDLDRRLCAPGPLRPRPKHMLPRPGDAARLAPVRPLLLRRRRRALHQHRRGQKRESRRGGVISF